MLDSLTLEQLINECLGLLSYQLWVVSQSELPFEFSLIIVDHQLMLVLLSTSINPQNCTKGAS